MAAVLWVAPPPCSPQGPLVADTAPCNPLPSPGAVQQSLKVPWGVIGDGCELHRDTFVNIKALPWRVKGRLVWDGLGMWITRPTAVGTATKT